MITAKVITEFDDDDILDYLKKHKKVYIWYNARADYEMSGIGSIVVDSCYDEYLVNYDGDEGIYIPIRSVVAFLEEEIS